MKMRCATLSFLIVSFFLQSSLCLAADRASYKKLTKWMDLSEQGIRYYYSRSYGKAESTFIKALAEIRRVKKDSNEELSTLARLVDVCLKRKNRTKAERYLDTLVLLYNKKAEDHSINKEAISELDSLSYTFGSFDTTDPATREKYLLQDLQLKDWVSGDKHKNITETLKNLVVFYLNQSKYTNAEQFATRLVKCDQKKKGFESPEVAQELNNLALIKFRLKKYVEAESYFRQCLSILMSLEANIPTYIPMVKSQLAENLLMLNECKLAKKESQEALKMLIRDVGVNDKSTITARRVLADAQARLGQTKSSIKQREIAVILVNRYYGINNPMNLKDLKILLEYYSKNKMRSKEKKTKNEIQIIEAIIKSQK